MPTLPPQPTEPFVLLAQQLVPQVQAAFMSRFDRAIDVGVTKIEDPESPHGFTVNFEFRMNKPGLLPTALEREFFNGFVTGYQAATQISVEILMTTTADQVKREGIG